MNQLFTITELFRFSRPLDEKIGLQPITNFFYTNTRTYSKLIMLWIFQ